MFTICPQCTKQFRLYAEQIGAANGQVRCGFCNMQFNVLERLHDEPLTNKKISSHIYAEPRLAQESLIGPRLKIQSLDESGIATPDDDLSKTTTKSSREKLPTPDRPQKIARIEHRIEHGIEQREETRADQDASAINSHTKQHTTADAVAVDINTAVGAVNALAAPVDDKNFSHVRPESATAYANETQDELPEMDALLEKVPTRQSKVLLLFWTSACVVGLMAIALQLTWFNRDWVLRQYPQLTPYVRATCKELGCRIIRQRDVRAIKLVNRDVRLHPDYQDVMLVNLTMNNALAIRQPYPKVQLTLFDTTGSLIGHRRFTPNDYLDNSIAIDAGMPANIPVHFMLEVSGPTAGAVSFEFRFL